MGALERGGDHPTGPKGGADELHRVLGPRVGLFRVLSFLPDWKEAVGLRGTGCPACVCVFRVVLGP